MDDELLSEKLDNIKKIMYNSKLDYFDIEDLIKNIKFMINWKKWSKIINNKHNSKLIECKITNTFIEIDENITSLLKEIWDVDIRTLNSCENNIPENYIWIILVKQWYR